MNINDEEYLNLVSDIINSHEINKLKNISHHGLTRYDHSLKVSYHSYKYAKKFKLNYKDVARAGLLHDFFYEENRIKKEKFLSFFTHPKKALKNSEKYFKLNKLESNIIESHMFPISIVLPKYKESILVSIIDKIVAVRDFSLCARMKIKYSYNFILLFLISSIIYKQ